MMRLSFIVLALALLIPAAACAGDFIRGDANGDGAVSVADVQSILNYVYRGDGTGCLEALDVNADGVPWLEDAWQLARYLVRMEPSPAAPFPQSGAPRDLGCQVADGGAPIIDPNAVLRILETVVDDSGRALINIELTHSRSLGGFYLKIRDRDGILELAQDSEHFPVDYTGLLDMNFATADDGSLDVVGVVGALSDQILAAPGEARLLVEIPICVRAGTAAGSYSLELLEAELADAETGLAIHPETVDGDIVVEQTVRDGCRAVVRTHVRYELGSATASQGEEAVIPFRVRASVATQFIYYSIDFDAEYVEVLSVDRVFQRPDGLPFPIEAHDLFNEEEIFNEEETEGLIPKDARAEGALGGIFMVAHPFRETLSFPVDEDFVLAEIRFRVKESAPAGSTTEIRFVEEIPARSRPPFDRVCTPDINLCAQVYDWENEVIAGVARLTAATADSFVKVPGLLQIVGDVAIFRGDANSDASVDISDAIFLLRHLFLGEKRPRCEDEADANDDGQIDVSDSLSILLEKFVGPNYIAPPYPDQGVDPTADDLSCHPRPPALDLQGHR